MTDLPKQAVSGRRQMASFAVVCACVFAARAYLAAIHGSSPSAGWRLPEGAVQFALVLVIAGILSAIAAWLGLRYYNKTSAVLMAAAAGGLATANSNGLIGAFWGGLAGLLLASRIARRVAIGTAAGVGAVSFGVAGGTFALWFDPDLSDGPCLATLCVLAVVLVTAGFALFGWWRINAAPRRWPRRLSKFGLPSLLIAGLWLSLSVDLVRRAQSLSPELSLAFSITEPKLPYWVELRPVSEDWLWHGPLRLADIFLIIRKDATDDDLRALRGWAQLGDVMIHGDRITDAGLVHVSRLRSLWRLNLSSPNITDRGVALLSDLRGLELLYLDGSQVTADGISRLSSLPRLRCLSLNDTGLADDDLTVLRLLPKLKSIFLSGTRISDEGLLHLTSLVSLNELDVSRTKVTRRGIELFRDRGFNRLDLSGDDFGDADLDALVAFTFINNLILDDTPITDAGVSTLAKISGLHWLSLRNTEITDAAIPAFEAMPALKSLDLRGTKVTKNGITRLYRTRTDCGLAHDSKD